MFTHPSEPKYRFHSALDSANRLIDVKAPLVTGILWTTLKVLYLLLVLKGFEFSYTDK